MTRSRLYRLGCAALSIFASLVLVLAQASNSVTFTERFDNGVWTQSDGPVITANTTAAPAFAGPSATLADTLADVSAVAESDVYQDVTVPDDSNTYLFSVYILKDAITTRFPDFLVEFRGGTSVYSGTRLNTSTGATAASAFGGSPTSGVVNVDASWWRIWMTQPNNSTGNTTVRLHIFSAATTDINGGNDSAAVGSVIAWGANLVQASSVQTYVPDPFYSFSASAPSGGLLGVGR